MYTISFNQFVTTIETDASTQVQIMTTYEKHLYAVTGSTQRADAPLTRATHVLKTYVEYMYSTIHKRQDPEQRNKEIKHNWEYINYETIIRFNISIVRVKCRLNWLMLLSARVDGRVEFHKIGPS